MSYGTNSWQPYQAGANGAVRYKTGYRGTAGADDTLPGEPPSTPVNPAMQDRNPGLGQQQKTPNQLQGNLPPKQSSSEQPNGALAPQGQPTAPPAAR